MTDDTMTDTAADTGDAIHATGASIDDAATLTTDQAAKLAVSIKRAAAMIRGVRSIWDAALNDDAFGERRPNALLCSVMRMVDQMDSIACSIASRFDGGAPILDDDMTALQRELRELVDLSSIVDDVAGIAIEDDADGCGPLMTVVQTQARMVGWIADSGCFVTSGSFWMHKTAEQWLLPEIEVMNEEQEQTAAAHH